MRYLNTTVGMHTVASLSRSVSRVALGGALLIASSATYAQTADTAAKATAAAAIDEIVVTGYRASIENSIRTKKKDLAIVESVTAEDIGKLPDVSIAESIARLPGLTAQRQDGRDQVISIRGLGPEFSTALLNGRQQVTTGDNRGVEFDQYPSELLNVVKVYKTPFASLIGQGLAGTVDLQTIRPLAQAHRIISVSGRYEQDQISKLNPDSSNRGFRASATYVDKFAGDTIGIAIGVAASSTPQQNDRFNAWGYPTDTSGNFILGGAKPYVQSNKLDRYGVVGTVQFKPGDNFESTLDVFYSKFREKQHLRGIEFPLYWNVGQSNVSNVTAANGFDTVATFSGVHAVQRNDYNQRDANTISIGWNNKLNITDKIRASVDVSYSRAKRHDFYLESYTGTGYNSKGIPDTVTVTRQPNGNFTFGTTLNYADPNLFVLTDPQGWGGNAINTGLPTVQAGFLNAPNFKDELKSIRANLDGDIDRGFLKSWQVGLDYGQRKKTSGFQSYFLRLPNGALTQAIPQAAIIGQSNLSFLGIPAGIAYDPLYVYNNVYVKQADIRPGSIVRDYSVQENVLTGFVQLNLDGQLGGLPLKGNIGSQFINTKQISDGSFALINVLADKTSTVTVNPVHQSGSYISVLPSLNLVLQADSDFNIHLTLARTLARPRLDQERVEQDYETNVPNIGSATKNKVTGKFEGGSGIFSFNTGNVQLRPYYANGVDLSFEKYFGGSGYVSLAAFYKQISSFIGQNTTSIDFTNIALATLDPIQLAILSQVQLSGPSSLPVNDGKGYLQGIEATLSLPFKLAMPALEGFGFQGNVSYTTSSIRYVGSSVDIPVPGLSKYTGNATLYFEKAGFELRGSYRYRSNFLGEISAISASRDFAVIRHEGIVDAQIGYNFKEAFPNSFLKGLSIQLQGKNLTDTPYITYVVQSLADLKDPRLVRDYQRYGRSFLLGLSYKY